MTPSMLETQPATALLLVRHGATEANLSQPPRLQGRHLDPPLAPAGVLQAEAARDFLAARPVARCFTSPLLRARQTAAILAAPHGLAPQVLEALTEADLGGWEGLDWATVRAADAERYRLFHADPSRFAPPGGETYAQVRARVAAALDELLRRHAGQTILVVSHHAALRAYLAGLLGLAPAEARRVTLRNAGVSSVRLANGRLLVELLDEAGHLRE